MLPEYQFLGLPHLLMMLHQFLDQVRGVLTSAQVSFFRSLVEEILPLLQQPQFLQKTDNYKKNLIINHFQSLTAMQIEFVNIPSI